MSHRQVLTAVQLGLLFAGCSGEPTTSTTSTSGGAGGHGTTTSSSAGGAGGETTTTTSSTGGAGGATTTSSMGGGGAGGATTGSGGAGGTTTTTTTTSTTTGTECVVAGDCPGLDTDCQQRACTSGFCGFTYAAALTPVPAQSAGDCAREVCDGGGGVALTYHAGDPPPGGTCPSYTACGAGLDPTIAGGTLLWTKSILRACPASVLPPSDTDVDVTGAAQGGVVAAQYCKDEIEAARVNASGALLPAYQGYFVNMTSPRVTLNQRGEVVSAYTYNFLGTSFYGGISQQSEPPVNILFSSDTPVSFSPPVFDALGNVFTISNTPLVPAGGTGPYLVRQGPSGTASRDIQSPASGLVADGTGGAILAVSATAATAFGCNIGGDTGDFVVRINAAQNCLWARPTSKAGLRLIATGGGGVLVTVESVVPLDLGCGLQTAVADGSRLVSRLGPAGNCLYAGSYPLQSSEIVRTPAGGYVISGTSDAPIDLGGGPLAPVGPRDLVVAAFDGAGDHLWSRRFGTPGLPLAGAHLHAAETGDTYLRTAFTGSVDFGGGAVTASESTKDLVVVSLGAAGAHRWSRTFNFTGGSDIDGCGSLWVVRRGSSVAPGATGVMSHYKISRYQP